MTNTSSGNHEAVLLFKDACVARELLYHEFEAILDGYIPVPEYAGGLVKAAYVTLDNTLNITGIVLFLIGFYEQGIADRRWNVPLRQLADTGGVGPDLGFGSIRLACYSQCQIPAQQKNLWDPLMHSGNNTFVAIYKAIKRNSLGLVASASSKNNSAMDAKEEGKINEQAAAIEKKLLDHYAQELQGKMESLANAQREHTQTLVDQHRVKDQGVQLELHRRLLAYEQKQAQIDREKQELETANKRLQEDLNAQTSKVDGMREYIAHRLKSVQEDEEEQLNSMQENFAIELDTKIRTATAEVREMLEMRDVELFYRHQTESVLKEEIAHLKKENQQLSAKSAQFMLDRFAKSSVNLAVNLPGLGDINVARDDVERFLEDPQTYAAERAGVTYPVYMSWLEHQQNPCCNTVDPSGRRCGKTITLVTTPAEFRSGESDRCEQHRVSPLSLVVARR